MKRKILDDIGLTDRWDQWYEEDEKRSEKFSKEREIYGFDQRETYSLRETFFEWLFERLTMYKEVASKVIDLESERAHHYEYNGKELSLMQLIDLILNNLEEYLTEHERAPSLDAEEQLFHKAQEAARIFVMILPSMWW